MIVLGNDDVKKMVERDELDPFLEEYAHVTGSELTLIGAGERPDFVCEKRGRRYGLEVVKAMQDPVQRDWEMILGGDGHLHGLDAAILIQDTVYRKEGKQALSWLALPEVNNPCGSAHRERWRGNGWVP